MAMHVYDRIGATYASTRTADPRIAAALMRALGGARTVVNVGAGAGSYEPAGRMVTAVEPSVTMIAHRRGASARVVRAYAEELPFSSATFDAAMAVLSDHHWHDRAAGLRELRRVARRAVVFTFDPAVASEGWIVRDYLHEFTHLAKGGMAIGEIAHHLGGATITPVPIPHDCVDGFFHAFWRRPEAYLDPRIRAGISVFAFLDPGATREALRRLGEDLQSGRWYQRNRAILQRAELDLGYRLLVAA